MADSLNPDSRRYRVRGVIGRGGFGTVYRADLIGQSGFTRAVPLKVLNPDVKDLPSIAERLRDEARLLGMLRHRSIVMVDGLVLLDGRWTIVMEYVQGVPVSVLADQHTVPVGVALEIAGEVSGALHTAHATPGPSGEPLALLHRDIKPANVLVGIHGEVKVLDFGVARANFEAREAKTQNMMFGSIGYMAPERYDLREEHVSDVYAVGVMLWELLTGGEYGRASSKPERYNAHKSKAMDTLQARNDLPDGLVGLVDRMLSYDPAMRPNAREVERQCRDLRLQAPAPWLRDWAEDRVPALIATLDSLEAHDFSSDVLSEAHSLGAPPPSAQQDTPQQDTGADTGSSLPIMQSLPTFTDDYLSEQTLEALPEPPAATPVVDSWSSELAEIASKRERPARPPAKRAPSSRPVRRPKPGPSGTTVLLQAFGGISLVAIVVGTAAVMFFTLLCCMCLGGS